MALCLFPGSHVGTIVKEVLMVSGDSIPERKDEWLAAAEEQV